MGLGLPSLEWLPHFFSGISPAVCFLCALPPVLCCAVVLCRLVLLLLLLVVVVAGVGARSVWRRTRSNDPAPCAERGRKPAPFPIHFGRPPSMPRLARQGPAFAYRLMVWYTSAKRKRWLQTVQQGHLRTFDTRLLT